MAACIDSSISLRPAIPDNAGPAAALIYEAAGTLGDFVFGQPGREDTIRVMAAIFPHKRHLFSYDLTTLAVADGKIVGILQALPGADIAKAGARLVWIYVKCFGIGAAIRMAWRSFPLAFEPDAKPGEFYIDTLAVASSHRNRGIGRILLEDAQRQARDLGFPLCSLSVMLHNADALRFYIREGFHQDLKYLSRLRAPGVQYTGFYRMIKPLEGCPAQASGAGEK
jgi:ribosomal protein S18 acetylase RimI-like enzyme